MLPMAPSRSRPAVQTPPAALPPRAGPEGSGRLFPCRCPVPAPARRGAGWQRSQEMGLCHLRDPACYLPGLRRETTEWREAVLCAGRMYDGGGKARETGVVRKAPHRASRSSVGGVPTPLRLHTHERGFPWNSNGGTVSGSHDQGGWFPLLLIRNPPTPPLDFPEVGGWYPSPSDSTVSNTHFSQRLMQDFPWSNRRSVPTAMVYGYEEECRIGSDVKGAVPPHLPPCGWGGRPPPEK